MAIARRFILTNASRAKNRTQTLAITKRNIKLQNAGLVALYDIQPGHGAGLFLQRQRPHGDHTDRYEQTQYHGACAGG